MGNKKTLMYAGFLFGFVLLAPLLLKNTMPFFAQGSDMPPYTQVVPVTKAVDPTGVQDSVQMNTFGFVTVTPTPTPIPSPTLVPTAVIPPTTAVSLQPAVTGGAVPISAPGSTTPNTNPSTAIPSTGAPAQGGSTAAIPSGQCGSVLDWSQKIVNALVVGQKGYDKLTAAFNSCGFKAADSTKSFVHYWCTYLIVDAYNLAGFKGLSIGSHAAVVNMRAWWKKASGYKYLDGNTLATVKAAAPGYAVFMETVAGTHTGKEHVFIIKTITMDANGNGSLTTLEANAAAKSRTFPIVGGQIKNTAYPVRGIGGR